ncbi:MAG: hypothetical protein LWX01_07245 [Deltaproteobacteria bacterium]|nr:hypothetical protein [Deltaproteobacteria bacterium]
MVLVEAKVVDSTHLELSKPIAARQGLNRVCLGCRVGAKGCRTAAVARRFRCVSSGGVRRVGARLFRLHGERE